MALLARLNLLIPLIIILAILAGLIYLFVQFRSSPKRAKEVLIKVFTWIWSAISIFFALVSLYALSEGNTAVLELAVMFLVVALIGLGIARYANHVFLKHNPHYRKKPVRAKTKWRFPWMGR